MRRDEAWLLDMLISGRKALSHSAGMDFASFQRNELVQLAVVHLIEIIGEAATHVSLELRNLHPEIPWNELAATRHRLIHGYFVVRLEKVWEVIQKDLPALMEQLTPLVPHEKPSP